MSSVLRPVHRRKKSRRLGKIEVIPRSEYEEMDLDMRVELILGLIPLGLMHVREVLQDELGSVIAPGTPLDEAAALIADDASINIDEDTLTFTASRKRTRDVLIELLADHRIGTQKNFDTAVDSAARALSPLVIVVD